MAQTDRIEVHKVTLYVVDLDGIGAIECRDVLENARYPNHCISPSVLNVETRVIDYHDEHPINITATAAEEARRLFAD